MLDATPCARCGLPCILTETGSVYGSKIQWGCGRCLIEERNALKSRVGALEAALRDRNAVPGASPRCPVTPDGVHVWAKEDDEGEEYFACVRCELTCDAVNCEACGKKLPHEDAVVHADEEGDTYYFCAACSSEEPLDAARQIAKQAEAGGEGGTRGSTAPNADEGSEAKGRQEAGRGERGPASAPGSTPTPVAQLGDASASPANPGTACRRCTECVGEEHHWIEGYEGDDQEGDVPAGELGWICKHCPAFSESVACEACGEEVPGAIAHLCTEDSTWLCPECRDDLKSQEASDAV
jgi:YHS domain-containing protein